LGLLNEVAKLIGGDVVDVVDKGGAVVAKHLVRQKREVIVTVYRRAREAGLSEEDACVMACQEFVERTL